MAIFGKTSLKEKLVQERMNNMCCYIKILKKYKQRFNDLKKEICYEFSNSSWLRIVRHKGYTFEDAWSTKLWELWYRTNYDDGDMLCIRNMSCLRPQTIEEYKKGISRLKALKEEFIEEFKLWEEKGGNEQ